MELLKINPVQKILKYFILILLGTVALTLSAKLKIPFYPVPMTMQTFVVLFLGITFGYKIGLATVGVYLFAGIIGIPVFSKNNIPIKPIPTVTPLKNTALPAVATVIAVAVRRSWPRFNSSLKRLTMNKE